METTFAYVEQLSDMTPTDILMVSYWSELVANK